VCWAKRERLAFSRSRALSQSACSACSSRFQVVDEVQGQLLGSGSRCARETARPRTAPRRSARWSRHGDRHPEIALDALVLADEHVEDHAVDRVVGAVVGDDPHLGVLLAEAVDPPLALLVARRVPGQVVMQHRVEVLLQVDALRQAVGADQHVLAALDECLDARPRARQAAAAGDGFDPDPVGERLAQVPCE
jgi:hypothetical protein